MKKFEELSKPLKISNLEISINPALIERLNEHIENNDALYMYIDKNSDEISVIEDFSIDDMKQLHERLGEIIKFLEDHK